MREYVIEGHDGAAKTPIANGVVAQLASHGLKAKVYAPFHEVNKLITGPDVYSYWQTEAKARDALQLFTHVAEDCRKKATQDGLDVSLFDRFWLTILCETQRYESISWTDRPPLFFIEAPVKKTLDCKRFSFQIPWTDSVSTVEYYYHRFLDLEKQHQDKIIGRYRVETSTQPLAPIIESITNRISRDFEK